MKNKACDAPKPEQPLGCEDLDKEYNAVIRFLRHQDIQPPPRRVYSSDAVNCLPEAESSQRY